MKKTATLNSCHHPGKFTYLKSNVKVFLMLFFLFSGLILTTIKSDAQCNSFGIDFKQGANRDGGYEPGQIHWIGSILQNSNSRYIEGMSTLQRIVINNLPTCGQGYHKLRVKMQSRKGDNHAYDFLTSWDNAFQAAAAIAPGFDIFPANRTDAVNDLNECGPEIGACAATACGVATGGSFRDLPIIDGETNLLIEGPPADQNTLAQIIPEYETRYGNRTVRVYVGAAGFGGDNGDVDNQVVFVGYGDANPNDDGDSYIYYDISWRSTSPDVVIEYGAHIAVGVDGLAVAPSLGVGYLLNRGASSISGGPYHCIIEDFQPTTNNDPKCEPNLGNLDNQLQGSQVLLIPSCDLDGPSAVCANGIATYTATVTNPSGATYLWEIINSSQEAPAATIIGSPSGNVPAPIAPATTTPLSITVNTGGVGSYTVKLTINNGGQTGNTTDDDISSSCTVATTVSGGPSITCPGNQVEDACQSQEDINSAFATWLASVSGSGTITNNNTGAPDKCGGTTTVTFTATNDCGTSTCSASFTVTAPASVTLTCPDNATEEACQSQDDIDAAFATWLATVSFSGGCDAAISNNNNGAPSACGGSTTVTFTVTSSCEDPVTCSATFTVTADVTPPVFTGGGSTDLGCNPGTESVNLALAGASATDNCGTPSVEHSDGTIQSDGCSRTASRTYTATDACGNTATTSRTVTWIADVTGPVMTCADSYTAECGATPEFTEATATDACGGATVEQLGDDVVGGECPTTYTRTWIATDACGNTSTCSQTVTVPCCLENCTYTQGAYGNEEGEHCDGENTYANTVELLDQLLAVPLTIGRPGQSLTVPATADGRDDFIEYMPAGGQANALNPGDCDITTACVNAYLKNGNFNNVLIGQTFALALNLRLSASLGSFDLQGGWLVTQELDGCGEDAVTVTCSDNAGAIQSFFIHPDVVAYLDANYGGSTVADLLDLANDALGGVITPGVGGVPTFSQINSAVDAINRGFDECRAFVGWYDCAVTCANIIYPDPCNPPVTRITTNPMAEVSADQLTVNAYPNPFTDQVRFVIRSRVSGQGSLEIYNMLGQRIETVYNGNIVADRSQIVEYRTSTRLNGGLIYIFRVGGKQATGKLLKIEQ